MEFREVSQNDIQNLSKLLKQKDKDDEDSLSARHHHKSDQPNAITADTHKSHRKYSPSENTSKMTNKKKDLKRFPTNKEIVDEVNKMEAERQKQMKWKRGPSQVAAHQKFNKRTYQGDLGFLKKLEPDKI